MKYPTRICERADGSFLVSDNRVGSVFVLDTDLNPTGEFKRCGRPLAVAEDSTGKVYVGDDRRNGIVVFDSNGNMLTVWGKGQVKKPNDMEFHHDGRLFVVDSGSNDVKIFSPKGKLLTSLGHPTGGWNGFDFPNAIAIGPIRIENSETLGRYVYVSDFMNARIAVFTDQGEFVKVLDGSAFSAGPSFMGMGMFGDPTFSKIQGLAFDATGNLHVLDCYQHKITVLDVESDIVISTHGSYGSTAGQLSLPLDLTIDVVGSTVVTNANVNRVDRIAP